MNENLSRDENVYLAKIYQIAERYSDMFKCVINFVKIDPNLTLEERNLFLISCKSYIADKRASWRIFNHIEKRDEKKNSQNLVHLKEIKMKLEEELRANCEEVQILLDKNLVPNSKDFETKVFYLKLKGDFFRFRAEFTYGKEHEQVCLQTEKSYKDAFEIAEKNVPIFSPTRLGLALNLSIFYYEVKSMKEEACHIARNAYEEAIKIKDELKKNKAFESLNLIKLLNENLKLWMGVGVNELIDHSEKSKN
jgi:14-3-3 protein epsilon